MKKITQIVTQQMPLWFTIFFLLTTMGFESDHKQPITLVFRHYAGTKKLKLFDEKYFNRFNEPVTFLRFKYYISHITIIGSDNQEVILDQHPYLIDEADSASKVLVFNSAAQSIQYITFQIGVDSILNVSGAQTDELDPLKGMFWTWNTGYIFARMEGRSDSSHAPSHYFNWDVGGFKSNSNALRKVILKIPSQDFTSNKPVIFINADVLQWFKAVHPVKIAEYPLCHQPGELAMKIADNYSSMFSIAP